jgi:hypothetical protein
LRALLGLLTRETSSIAAGQLAEAVAGLHPTGQEQAQTRQALLRLLTHKNDDWDWGAMALVAQVSRLHPTGQEQAQARQALLDVLADDWGWTWDAREVADLIAELDPSAQDRARAWEVLLGLLARETHPEMARRLAAALARLAVTAEERARARQAVLGLLARKNNDDRGARALAAGMAELDPTAQDRAQAREMLLGLQARQTDPVAAHQLAETAAGLAVTAEERAAAAASLELTTPRARNDLLDRIDRTSARSAADMALQVAKLDPTARDRARARKGCSAIWPSRLAPRITVEGGGGRAGGGGRQARSDGRGASTGPQGAAPPPGPRGRRDGQRSNRCGDPPGTDGHRSRRLAPLVGAAKLETTGRSPPKFRNYRLARRTAIAIPP